MVFEVDALLTRLTVVQVYMRNIYVDNRTKLPQISNMHVQVFMFMYSYMYVLYVPN